MESWQDAGLWDPVSGSYSAYPEWATASNVVPGGVDFGGGWAQTLQDVARVAASTYSQKTLMQQNQQGQAYIEGQRMAGLRQVTGISPTMLMLIGGAALFFLLKG